MLPGLGRACVFSDTGRTFSVIYPTKDLAILPQCQIHGKSLILIPVQLSPGFSPEAYHLVSESRRVTFLLDNDDGCLDTLRLTTCSSGLFLILLPMFLLFFLPSSLLLLVLDLTPFNPHICISFCSWGQATPPLSVSSPFWPPTMGT